MADYNSKTSIDHLLNRSTPEKFPLLSFKWICESLPYGLDPTYVETLDLPFSNISQQQGWYGASTYTYYPDFNDISTFGITFYEDSSATTLQWITAWKNRVITIYPTSADQARSIGAYNLPKNYKQNMKFTLLATDNSPVIRVTLVNVWPTDTQNFSFDYTQSDRVKVSQTFSCDGQEIEFLKSPNLSSFGDARSQVQSAVWSNLPSSLTTSLSNFFNLF